MKEDFGKRSFVGRRYWDLNTFSYLFYEDFFGLHAWLFFVDLALSAASGRVPLPLSQFLGGSYIRWALPAVLFKCTGFVY